MNKHCLLLIAYLLAAPFSRAAQNDSLPPVHIALDEVVVQSFKQDKNFRFTPVSATAVPQTVLANRNITNIKDFSAFIPNLFIPDYGSKLTSPVYIRGIGSKINSPSVGLYVDGIPYFEKAAFDFNFSEIDRVEVLRGPQGTLHGRNTMGGIINVYTKSPFKYQGTNLNISAGSYTNIDASASHYGNINQTLGYAISANYQHSDGYFTNLFTSKKADPVNAASGRIRLSWHISPQVDLHLTTNYDHSNQGGYPYALYDAESGKTGPVNYNNYSFYKRNMSTTGFTVDYHTDRFKLNAQTAYQYFSDHQGIDQDFSPNDLYFVTQNQQQHMFSEEINIKSNTTQSYQWLFGAFVFYQRLNNEVAMDDKTVRLVTDKFYVTPTYGGALYHQSTVNHLFTENLSLILGARYDIERARTTYNFYKITDGTVVPADNFKSKLTFSQFTPKVSIQYNIRSQSMLYATVTKGYKAGGFNTSFIREEERSFRPEHSWNYEIGTKLSFFDNRLTSEISLFYIDWKNQQIYQPLSTGKGSLLKNAGRSASKGVEISVQSRPLASLILRASYGYTHATFKEYQRNDTVSYAGNRLPLVPSHTVSAGADYTIYPQSGWMEKMVLSAQYTGTGALYWNEANDVSQPFYNILNAKIAFVKGPVTLACWAKNLTNTAYTAFYFEAVGARWAQKGKTATFGAQFIFNF